VLRFNFGKGAGGWVQERTLFLVFFYTLLPIRYPLFQFLRALHRRGERRSPYDGHPPDAPTIETIVPSTFCENIKY
jgi:hypothetical protein